MPEGVLPRPNLCTCLSQHPVPELHDRSGFLGEVDEPFGFEQTECRVMPAHQCLDSA
jgi:hypothetical protein